MAKTYPAGNRKTAPKRKRNGKRRGPLAAWMAANKKKLKDASAQLGVSVQHLSNLIHGHSKPSLEIAVKIEAATGGAVTVGSWGK